MENNSTVPREGFKRRPLRDKRVTAGPGNYRWTNDPVGRCAIYFIQRFGEEMLGPALNTVLITRQIAKNGLHGDKLRSRVLDKVPEFAAYYASTAGREFTSDIAKQRAYMGLVYENGPAGVGGKPIRPREHYTRSPRLRPHVEAMERLLLAPGTATIAQLREAGDA